ncbi:MAG: hypothetical protein U0Y82_12735 [Thermoleophilia bacterium]
MPALAIAVLLSVAGAGTAHAGATTAGPPAHFSTTPSGTAVPAKVFVGDITRFSAMLSAFGHNLQRAAAGPRAMRALAPHMRRQLAVFDEVTAKMAAYTVDSTALERKRAAIVEAAPPVSRLGRQLIRAALAGKVKLVKRTAAGLEIALRRLEAAAKA